MGRYRWPSFALLIAVITVIAAVACSQELTPRERAVQQNLVEDRLNTWVRLMNNAAPGRRRGPETSRQQAAAMDTLFGMYADEDDLIVMWPHGERTEGRAQMEQVWRTFYDAIEGLNFVLQRPTVEVLASDVAVSSFRHSADVRRSMQQTNVEAGHGTLIWTKDPEDGLWKIHLSQIAYQVPES